MPGDLFVSVKMGVISLICSLALIAIASGQGQQCCPDAWVAYQGSCYLFTHDISLSFFESEHYCTNHGAHLVNIGSKSEDLFVRDFLSRANNSQYWLGLTDELVEGVWRWRDTGLEATYTDWFPGEPNSYNGTNEDCALYFQPFQYMWVDAPCAAPVSCICEMELNDHGHAVVG